MRIDLTFRLPGVRNANLQLPAEWQGQRELYKAIHDIQAVSAQTVNKENIGPARRQLSFPLGRSSTLGIALRKTGRARSPRRLISASIQQRLILSIDRA